LVQEADVIVSVGPPHAALEMARQVAALGLARQAAGFGGLSRQAAGSGGLARQAAGSGGLARQAAGFGGVYVDANAVSPATAREIARIIEDAGASYVDGGIIGTPPVAPGFIRLYLSGARAGEVQRLFAGGEVDARVIGGDASGAASAVKMAYASWTKGSTALLLTARALARAEGVEEALLAEWGISQPGLAERSARAAGSAAAKGWRWVAEMEEIAAAMAAAGLPGGFHRAAAEVYRRAGADGSVDAILTTLLSPP
jgi:3-hydroxyisobutyrate dehydrogenase-like beta-hydroxyacid dehydrogenase